jgi:SAM-dependent methyltransferase
MPLPKQTPAWYDQLSTLQSGYYYPWRSTLPKWNGEDVYRQMVEEHLRLDADVLDAACGHGAVAIDVAPRVRSVLGYDRTRPWIDLATRTARERGLGNVTFVHHDSSPAGNGGKGRVPAPDGAFDLLLCSKGPFHWIEDARRVARPGATLLMLVPDATPLTPWHPLLPEPLWWQQDELDPNWARPAVERRLALADLALESWWSFDVPEIFPDPEQLYAWLTFGDLLSEVPTFEEVRPLLERIFGEYGSSDGLAIRRHRYIWKAVVPASR